MNIDERKKIRQEKSKVQLETIKEYLDQQSMSNIVPQSPVGKAIVYSLSRWYRQMKYVDHGVNEIDNNLIENSIRPLALGIRTSCLQVLMSLHIEPQ
ncbi:MAG: transposase [Saprospiraceae bacterium]|nr:transposase [Saprospiraceae bacterium]